MQDHHQEGQWEGPLKEMRRNVNILIFICQVWSMPMLILLRKPGTWGDRFAGFHMGIGLLAIPLIGIFATPQEEPEQLTYLLAFWGMLWLLLLVHRIRRAQLRRRGYSPHSRYSGVPQLRGQDEVSIKRTKEPSFVTVLAVMAIPISIPLAVYLGGAALGLVVSTEWQYQADQARLRDVRDAQLDGAWLQANYRREE